MVKYAVTEIIGILSKDELPDVPLNGITNALLHAPRIRHFDLCQKRKSITCRYKKLRHEVHIALVLHSAALRMIGVGHLLSRQLSRVQTLPHCPRYANTGFGGIHFLDDPMNAVCMNNSGITMNTDSKIEIPTIINQPLKGR